MKKPVNVKPSTPKKSKLTPEQMQKTWKHLQETQESFIRFNNHEYQNQKIKSGFDIRDYSEEEIHSLFMHALVEKNDSMMKTIFESGFKVNIEDIVAQSNEDEHGLRYLKMALDFQCPCMDSELLFSEIIRHEVSFIKSELKLIHDYLPDLKPSEKTIFEIWDSSEITTLAAFLSSGISFLPRKWNLNYQRNFHQLLTDFIEESSLTELFTDEMNTIIESIKPYFSPVFQPLKPYLCTSKSTQLWEMAFENENTQNIILFFLKHNILPTEKSSKYFQVSNEVPLSWPLCALLSSEQTLFEFLMTDKNQERLFLEDLNPNHKNLLKRINIESISYSSFILLFQYLDQYEYDFSQKDDDGNTFFNLWFHHLSDYFKYCSEKMKKETAIPLEKFTSILKYSHILLDSKNEYEEACFDINDFKGLYINNNNKISFIQKNEIFSKIEQQHLLTKLPSSTHKKQSIKRI